MLFSWHCLLSVRCYLHKAISYLQRKDMVRNKMEPCISQKHKHMKESTCSKRQNDYTGQSILTLFKESTNKYCFNVPSCIQSHKSNIMATTTPAPVSKNKQYRKDKPWDDPSIDHWQIQPLAPEESSPFLQESSFSVLFPQYRQKYIQECQGLIKKRLMESGVKFELNLL